MGKILKKTPKLRLIHASAMDATNPDTSREIAQTSPSQRRVESRTNIADTAITRDTPSKTVARGRPTKPKLQREPKESERSTMKELKKKQKRQTPKKKSSFYRSGESTSIRFPIKRR